MITKSIYNNSYNQSNKIILRQNRLSKADTISFRGSSNAQILMELKKLDKFILTPVLRKEPSAYKKFINNIFTKITKKGQVSEVLFLQKNQEKLVNGKLKQKEINYIEKYIPSLIQVTKESIENSKVIIQSIKKEMGIEVLSVYHEKSLEFVFKVLKTLKKKNLHLPKEIVLNAGAEKGKLLKSKRVGLYGNDELYCEIFKDPIKTLMIFTHEIGHFLHEKKVSKELFLNLRVQRFNDKTKALISENLNDYAATNPLEFVAEFYANLFLGISKTGSVEKAGTLFPKELVELYKLCKGHLAEKL